MPKFKRFKPLAMKHKKIESLPQSSPPSPADVNSLVQQQLSSGLETRMPILNHSGHLSRIIEQPSIPEQQEDISRYPTDPKTATSLSNFKSPKHIKPSSSRARLTTYKTTIIRW